MTNIIPPVIIDLDPTSQDDFMQATSRRRRRSSSSSSSQDIQPAPTTTSARKRRAQIDDADEESDGKDDLSRTVIQNEAEVCPICLEQWTNSGQHRLVATECGHLYGKM